ncbi:MAG TPA: NAD(P)-dependent oxidoreductase [Acidobacteriota bacterium]|nr:NAD(P)-dependent oxidoreductase [Acidobacteriota bacterium]
MSKEAFFITGALGCVGSWVLRNLVDEGVTVVASDLSTDPVRPRLLLSDDELSRIEFVKVDITDLESLRQTVASREITHIIHLAALQVPFCIANPSLGSQVNVTGTVNIFEVARHLKEQIRGLAFTSSIAVMGPADRYPDRPLKDDVELYPQTLYGVYKQANEQTARVYWQDWGIPSVSIRPYIIYGIGRDQGLTSDVAKAILAAAAGQEYEIRFSGPISMQYADDVAKILIRAARSEHRGAAACNLRGDILTVEGFVTALQSVLPNAQVRYSGSQLPFPSDLSDEGLRAILGELPHTPLDVAIRETAERFTKLLQEGRVDLQQLKE